MKKTMKKTILTSFLAAALMTTACASLGAKGQQEQQQQPASAQTQANAGTAPVMNTPPWIDERAPADAFYGIGAARMQRQERSIPSATARARRDIAEQLNVLVQGMLIDYFDQGGNISNEDANDFTMSVGRELVNASLAGAEPINRTQTTDGYWWIRVALSKDDAKREIINTVNRQASRYSQVRAEDALRNLDTLLERTNSIPTPRMED
jgi:hypothetical protein